MTSAQSPATRRTAAWAQLLLASLFEIGYALSVGASEAFTVPLWSAAAAVFFLLTLYFLSAALRTIPVSVGYAVWAGIGAVGAVVFGALLLQQAVSGVQLFWLAVIIAGVIWLKLADRPQPDLTAQPG